MVATELAIVFVAAVVGILKAKTRTQLERVYQAFFLVVLVLAGVAFGGALWAIGSGLVDLILP